MGQHSRVSPVDGARATTFRGLFRSRDFAVLWTIGAQSQIGDELARVALSIIVFARTGSSLATAATYALTYLPEFISGLALTGLADTLPRRPLLLACNVVRAALFAVMAVPAVPLPALAVLVALAVMAGSPANAAEAALVADLFDGDEYTAAQGLRTATTTVSQILGFAVGGVVVAFVGAHVSLLVDAITFALAAVLVQAGLQFRPATGRPDHSAWTSAREGLRLVWSNPRLRFLLGMAWLNAWWIVPEGLAAPYAARLGGGPVSVGLLLAAVPVGNLIGVVVLTRFVPSRSRSALIGVLAVASGIPLIVCWAAPPIAVTALLWALCGVAIAYIVLIVTEFIALVPASVRGQAVGIAGSGLVAAQGLGLLIGGVFAAAVGPAAAIALAGLLGSAMAALFLVVGPRGTTGEVPAGS